MVLLIHPLAAADERGERLLRDAATEMSFFNFEAAQSGFEAARNRAEGPGSELWREATLGLALALQSRSPATPENVAAADGLYRELAEAAPGAPEAARALLQRGRIAEVRDFGGDAVDLEAARGFYQEVLDGWPEEDVADEAALRWADTLFQDYADEASVREGEAFLSEWVAGRPERPMAPVIHEVLGGIRIDHLGDVRGGVDALIAADEAGLVDPNAAGLVLWRIASLSDRELGDAETAVDYYRRVIVEAPRSGRAFSAQLALEDLRRRRPELGIEIPPLEMLLSDDTGGEAENHTP